MRVFLRILIAITVVGLGATTLLHVFAWFDVLPGNRLERFLPLAGIFILAMPCMAILGKANGMRRASELVTRAFPPWAPRAAQLFTLYVVLNIGWALLADDEPRTKGLAAFSRAPQ